MNIINEIIASWSWTGIKPTEIVAENEFGNLIIKDADNKFWRLCPEDVYCEVVAESIDDYNTLINDDEFLNDWNMTVMVKEATVMLGALKEGDKYYMVIPGILNGEYSGKNIQMAPFIEIISLSGNLGKEIKDLPDGAKVELKVID
ncbi:MAG: DUF1851 domain-containing protein [Woeseiaceae bacterium]